MKKLLLISAMLSGCASIRKDVGTAPEPSKQWTPPANTVIAPKAADANPLPDNYTPGMPVSLAQVIDIALANNPSTRIAWLQARTAQAQIGIAESAWYPQVDVGASIVNSSTPRDGGGHTSYGPFAEINWLLFDFGGRAASVEAARQTLISSNLLHNQSIQDVIFRTQQAYYSYLDARALLAAEDATIKERQMSLDAADARHNAGVATIADVLQARTALSQAQLNRETFEGNLHTIEGLLATTMGLPATTRFEFGELPLDIPTKRVAEAVDQLIDRAVTQRPDLAAARADAERANVRIRQVRAQYLPSVALSSSLAGTWTTGAGNFSPPHQISVGLRWPIFTGFRNVYDVRAAEIEAQTAQEDVRALVQQVNLQVWTSYYSLKTAEQRLVTARDLLSSAEQSVDVARSRYRAGVGSILDLLTAQSALESARAQEVQARTDWFLSVAQLAHDTGSLEPLP